MGFILRANVSFFIYIVKKIFSENIKFFMIIKLFKIKEMSFMYPFFYSGTYVCNFIINYLIFSTIKMPISV